MSISLKAELETWATALKAYDEQDFEKALSLFSLIGDSSKILTNIGLIYATIGDHETAVEHFVAATNLDSYLAIAYFQCGVSNFLLERYDQALLNFEDASLYLRGNEAINYEQIGLKFKLFSAEIMFNKGLAELNLGYTGEGMATMQEASKQKVTDEHGVIDEAIRDQGEGYTVFSIPVGVLYRPSENKLKNSKTKDYLGKAKLVAASDSNDAFTEFTGAKKLQQENSKVDDKKTDADSPSLSRNATVPTPRAEPVVARSTPLERSKTAAQPSPGVRPDAATILASRRMHSVSNPTNTPQPTGLDPSRNNTALGRSNTTRSVRSATPSAGTRSKIPQSTTNGVVGVTPSRSRTRGETETVPWTPRSPLSLRRQQGQRLPTVTLQSASQPPPLSLQSDKHMKATPGAIPLILPAVPVPLQDGHLTQFYDQYIDAYSDDLVSQSPNYPPTAQGQSSTSSSRMQSPSSFYQQPPPQLPEQQPSIWMQSVPSPSGTSSNTSMSSGSTRAPSRVKGGNVLNANPTVDASNNPKMEMNQSAGVNMEPNITANMDMGGANMSKGGTSIAGANASLRKLTRRPTARRMMYEEGDDEFVTSRYDEIEMANIRVKLHYQGDVRGMAIPPTTSFNEFVERVTTKFGTSLMGLGMKFMDEEGTKISLRDESDFELAIETARENAKGRSEGKIEVWCVDV